jgi:hypothetical protein
MKNRTGGTRERGNVASEDREVKEQHKYNMLKKQSRYRPGVAHRVKVKVKQSRYRPGVAQRDPGT